VVRDLTEVVVDGQRWRLLDTGAGTEVVVLLHPIGLDAGWWRPHAEVLADRYRVLAVDLPGHGGTEVALPYSFRAAGAGIARLLDALGITRDVTVVGVSMGGMIAPWLAAHSSAVTSLLLVATAASFPPEARAAIRDRAAAVEELGMAGLTEQTLQRWFAPALLAAGDPLVARARATLEAADPRVHAACWRAIAELDASEVLGGLPLPTTVLAGETDASLPLARAEELVALLPQARLEIHTGGSHLFAFEGHDWLLPALERTGPGREGGGSA
jgi:pimeloyl-ACP methyl ester carboxylesterase